VAYRLRPRESVAHGLRRVARKELRSARDQLSEATPPDDQAIHEARKSVKKVRAILLLIDADEGRGQTNCHKRLRKVNRTLSDVRDPDAMTAILTKLTRKNSQLFDEHSLARLRRRLSALKQTAMEAARNAGAWKTLDRELRNLRQDAKGWRPRHRQFRALAAGIRRTYRRGRKAMSRARRRQTADNFHEWRKHIKALWYELRLVEGCTPGIKRDVTALHRAETWLGDDHNVVVLSAELSKDGSLCDLEQFRRAADRYQCQLRQRTIARMRSAYARTPGEYVRRVKRAWESWRRNRSQRSPRRRRVAA
jgi:CHAD domain-containing protein